MEEKRQRRRAQLGQPPSGPGISGIGQGPVVPEQPQLQQSGQQSGGSQQIPSRNALQELKSALRRPSAQQHSLVTNILKRNPMVMSEFINERQQSLQHRHNVRPPILTNPPDQPQNVPDLTEGGTHGCSNNIPTASKTSQEEPKENGHKCMICFEPPEPMFMFLNCGHLPFCDQCSAKIMKERKICPICREYVSKRQRAYFQQA